MSITIGNKTGAHKHEINFNKSISQLLLNLPVIPRFNKKIVLDTCLTFHIDHPYPPECTNCHPLLSDSSFCQTQ